MTTYYVWNGGSNGDGLSWANAKTTLAAAIALATASGDVILIEKTHTGDNALAADTTFTFLNHVSLICVDKAASDALAEMGTAAWIGHSSLSRAITLLGGYRVFIYGVTWRLASITAKSFYVSYTDGSHVVLEKNYLWMGAGSITRIIVGAYSNTEAAHYTEFRKCTIRFGASGQGILPGGTILFRETVVSDAGTAPTLLFQTNNAMRCPSVQMEDCDLSYVGSGTLVGAMPAGAAPFVFYRCKLGANAVPLASQAFPSLAGASCLLLDCSSGDTHGLFGYYDAFGSVVSDTGIYFTAGAAQQSWKIVTSANAGREFPFVTPPIPVFHDGTSAITPYMEILRDGSTTAYKDNEVWAEFALKTTSGTVLGTASSDAATLLTAGASQANGAGLGSWTGESGTAWSGKCGLGASVTPAETGEIVARVSVGAASATVYVDPQVRW